MARRGAEDNFRTSIKQVAEQESISTAQPIEQTIAQIGQQIIRSGQEAKINENFSKVQLELNQLNQRFQLDFEGDPFSKQGLAKLSQDRDAIFERHGAEISPFFKRPWQDSLRKLKSQDDATTQVWGYAQTKKNTVTSINQSINNNFSQAAIDGANFGNSAQDGIGSMLNFTLSKEKLVEFADRNLGVNESTEIFENYNDDYLKAYIGGVSQSNPLKALRMIERDDVRESFKDKQQYLDMKDAIETRAVQSDKIFGEQNVLDILKVKDSLLTKSIQANVPYVELQKEFDRIGASPFVQSFFLKANGFKKKTDTLSKTQKHEEEVGIYEAVRIASEADDMTPKRISALEDRIYKAMDKNAISPEEGAEYIDQFITPLVDQREEDLSGFQRGKNNPFQDNIGFSGLDPLLDQVIIGPEEGDSEVSASINNINNRRKLKLYGYYRDALQQAASVRNIKLGQIPRQPKAEKISIYSSAQDQAKKNFFADEYNFTRKDGEWPDSFITPQGKKIVTGLIDGGAKSSISIPEISLDIDSMTEEELDRFLAE